MLAKIELSLAPSKAKGLSEDERLELGRLLLKAGYRVDIVRRRPNANPGTQYEYYKSKGVTMSNYSGAASSSLHWARSTDHVTSEGFHGFNDNGYFADYYAAYTYCVFPVWCF